MINNEKKIEQYMNKLFTAILAFSALACGCGKDAEKVISSADPKVVFNPMITTSTNASSGNGFVENSSRASVITSTELKQTGFVVYSYTTPGLEDADWSDGGVTELLRPDKMFEMEVTYSLETSTWGYNGAAYWPQKDLLSFFAITPMSYVKDEDKIADENTYGAPEVSITTPAHFDEQVDFLSATELNLKPLSSSVNLKFIHTLSRIGFSARLSAASVDEGNNICIEKAEVFYVENLVFDRATLNMATQEWEIDGGSFIAVKDASTNVEFTLYDAGEYTDGVNLASVKLVDGGELRGPQALIDEDNPDSGSGIMLDSTDPKSLNTDDDFFMFIPQDYAAEAIFLRVEYMVNGDSLESKIIPLPAQLTDSNGDRVFWTMGKQYNYLLTFDVDDDETYIIFGGVSVNEWAGEDYFEL